jgi:hypothetical protein
VLAGGISNTIGPAREAAANSLSVQRRSDHEAGREGQNLIFIRIANTPAASHYGLFGIFDFRAE